MLRTITALITPVIAMTLLAACGSSDDATAPEPGPSGSTTATGPPDTNTPTPGSTAGTTDAGPVEVVGTTLRFSRGSTRIDVTLTEDNATARDLLSSLPRTVRFEELNGREKISYLPRNLDTTGAPGHDPENGDLIYYAPWGNLGFYYNADGIGFDENVIGLGTYDATNEELAGLEGDVTIEIVP